jgi:RNA polymerase sigma-70 factor (ECF subfamily)
MNIDSKLLSDCKKSDRKAQLELYKLCFQSLMNICFRYEKNEQDARAIMNKGFFKILTGIKDYNDKIPFNNWIKRIMINTAIDHYRKNKKYNYHILHNNEINENGYIIYEGDVSIDSEKILSFIQKLPSSTQHIFNLFAIDGYSHKEIAEQLGISTGTSKWHVSEARKKLRAWIGETYNLSVEKNG